MCMSYKKNLGLYCKRALWKRLYSAKEPYKSHVCYFTGLCSLVCDILCMCDMTHFGRRWYVWHDSILCVTEDIDRVVLCVTYFVCAWCVSRTWLTQLTPKTRPICVCDVTHLYVWHDLFVCVTRLNCMRDMYLMCPGCDSLLTCRTRRMCTCDVNDLYTLVNYGVTTIRRLLKIVGLFWKI